MAVVILPDAQADLLSMQDHMLAKWGEAAWLKAEDEIFDKLSQVDAGLFNGTPVQELASVGIMDYRYAITSHHKLLYLRLGSDIFVYLIAGHRKDYPTLLERRMFRR